MQRPRTRYAGIALAMLLMVLPADAAGVRRLMIGNSLSNGICELLGQLCKDGGYADDWYAIHPIAGAPLDYHWLFDRTTYLNLAQQATPCAILSLQPFGFANSGFGDVEAEFTAAANMYRQMLTTSPACTVLVYYGWPGGTISNPATWVTQTGGTVSTYLEVFTDMLKAEFPGKPIFVVPAGAALLALVDSVNAGMVPGITDTDSLFHDDIHLSANGAYFVSCLHYACIYRQSPVGLPRQYTFNSGGMFTATTSLTAEQAAVLQRIAWQVAQAYPRSPLCSALRVRTDTIPPTRPLRLSVVSKNANSVTLSLGTPSTDNIAVSGYSVYINDFFFKYVTGMPLVLSACLPPDSNLAFYVRGRDAAYNISAYSDTLQVRTDATVKGSGYRYDFGASTSPVARGWTQVVNTELQTAGKPYGFVRACLGLDFWNNAINDFVQTAVTDSMQRDGVGQWCGLNFRVNVPSDSYRVRAWVGVDRATPSGVSIHMEQGDTLKNVSVSPAGCVAESLLTTVNGGYTTLYLGSTDPTVVRLFGLELVSTTTGVASGRPAAPGSRPAIVYSRGAALRLRLPEATEASVRVVDMRGRTVLSAVLPGGVNALPVQSLAHGCYRVVIRSAATGEAVLPLAR